MSESVEDEFNADSLDESVAIRTVHPMKTVKILMMVKVALE